MVLSDDLYNESGKVLLIRAGERITEKTIGQLKNLGTEDACVMTCEETYEKIMNAKIRLTEAVRGLLSFGSKNRKEGTE